MNVNLKPYLDGKVTFSNLIESIKKQNGKLELLIQQAAVLTIYYAVKDGNVATANQMINALAGKEGALGKLIRKNQILEWLEVNGPFIFDNESKTFGLDKRKRKAMLALMEADTPKFLGDLMRNNIAEKVKAEGPYEGFNFRAKLEKLVKSAVKAERTHGDEGNVDVTGLDAIVKTMNEVFKYNYDPA